MPDRMVNMMAPLARLHARKMAPAFEALCAQACLESAMTGALVSRGVAPGTAQMIVDQWQGLGLFIPPSVYAPAHVAEATLTGGAVPTTMQVTGAQPWLAHYLALAPGYERLAGPMGKGPGMMGPGWGPMGKGPGMMGPGWGPMGKGPGMMGPMGKGPAPMMGPMPAHGGDAPSA